MFRFLKNKRKYTYPEIKIPEGCRELTEEEMLMVNGGGKAKEETTVTVERGDTLSELTARLNEQNGTDYTYQEIAQMNGITDPNTIYVGQTIVFPGASQATTDNSGTSGSTSNESSSSSNSASTSAKPSGAATVTNPSAANKSSSGFYSSTFNEKVEKYKKI
ncbi:MAG: LysM peptidoglycan-binding domain-containing protein [Treponema sp.]|nr:LysM peptidoglycan-binding domain-containing protein [Treponema sp.]